MDRRTFLKTGLIATAAVTSLGTDLWRRALAGHPSPVRGDGPYGAPALVADGNGMRLPNGFRSRVLAVTGEPVPGTAFPWHAAPDGAATFATVELAGHEGGGWIYVCNSEAPAPLGGVSAIRFRADGTIDGPAAAYRICSGTSINCAGGSTPWGTWLTCEEHVAGLVWECDPNGIVPAIPRPALGTFQHEAAVVDPRRGHVYLTEDQSDGGFYRFTPDTPGDLSSGVLEIAEASPGGTVRWHVVPDPNGLRPQTKNQVPHATRFKGGEGAWFDADADAVYFTTKGDDRIWVYSPANASIEVLYDGNWHSPKLLNGVDNITVSPGGEIFVCEDHSSAPHELVMLSPAEQPGDPLVVSPFLVLEGHAGSELTGVCFNPAGDRMYVSSQRGQGAVSLIGRGITYEITGPFNRP